MLFKLIIAKIVDKLAKESVMKLNIRKISLIIALYILIDALIKYLYRGVDITRPMWFALGIITILVPLIIYGSIKLILDKVQDNTGKKSEE